MDASTELSQAIWLAWTTHRRQRDKSDEPYLGHVARVAARVAAGGPTLQAVAWLHDVIEDGELTADDLADQGFNAEVVDAVDALTRRGPAESDSAYLLRVCANPLARMVKRADTADNGDPARLAALDDETRVRLTAKYAAMRATLGDLSHLRPSTFTALGAADLAWAANWDDDPIRLYECFPPAIATEAIGLVRRACLDEAIVTPVLKAALPAGCELLGLQHRVKSPSGTAARLLRSTEEIGKLEDPKDMLRFTAIVDENRLWVEATELCTALADRLNPVRARSFFVQGNYYYGIHTWWEGTSGLFIELQLHTRTSYRVKDETHPLYEIFRSPSLPADERRAAWEGLLAAWADHPIPEGRPGALGGIELQRRYYPAPTGDTITVRSVPVQDGETL